MQHTSRIQPGRTAILAVVLGLWLVYTVFQVLNVTGALEEKVFGMLAFLPGLAGVFFLRRSGLSRSDLFLQIRPLSRPGLAILAGIFAFSLSVMLPFGRWQGWDWANALFYAPASGISQELFFRSVLLPAGMVLYHKRPWAAILIHSIFFSLWHIGALFAGAPLWAALAVMLVPFLCGIGWGWQVQHDRSVVWAMLQHSLIWVIAGQFPMTG